jgi:hypothetical protein
MKVLSNRLIVKEWKNNRPAKNRNNTFFTDGKGLYSYRLLIGTTSSTNYKIVYDYTKQSDNFISQTTSRHVHYAKSSADFFLHPEDVKII